MELNGGLYIATFDHARKKMKFNMEPKEMGEKNEKKHPDPSSAQKVLSAPSHLSFPSSKSYHDETTIIFRLEMGVPIFFLRQHVITNKKNLSKTWKKLYVCRFISKTSYFPWEKSQKKS
jgi:hypothetical protein